MNKEYVVCYVILFNHKKEQNCVVYKKMDRTGNHHTKLNKPG
jgi:hypothetical protein